MLNTFAKNPLYSLNSAPTPPAFGMHRKRPLIPKNLSQRCTCTFSTVPHVFKSPLAPSKSHSKYVYENRTESRTSVAAFQFYRTRSMTLLPDRRDLEPKNRPLPDHAQLPVNEPIINFKKNDTGEGGAVNQKKGMSEEPYEANLRGRTVSLTPWKGAPTFLHAVAFVRELEKRYGKIEWCGISRVRPYLVLLTPRFLTFGRRSIAQH